MRKFLFLWGEYPVKDAAENGGCDYGINECKAAAIAVNESNDKRQNHCQAKKEIEKSQDIENQRKLHSMTLGS